MRLTAATFLALAGTVLFVETSPDAGFLVLLLFPLTFALSIIIVITVEQVVFGAPNGYWWRSRAVTILLLLLAAVVVGLIALGQLLQ